MDDFRNSVRTRSRVSIYASAYNFGKRRLILPESCCLIGCKRSIICPFLTNIGVWRSDLRIQSPQSNAKGYVDVPIQSWIPFFQKEREPVSPFYPYQRRTSPYDFMIHAPEANPESDESLLQFAGSGDVRAFEKLYDRLSPRLFGIIRQMVDDPEEAADVLQEGFVYLWNHAGNFDPSKSKAFTWSVMIFRNKAIDRLRTRSRRARLQQQAILEIPLLTSEHSHQADHAADHRDRCTQVNEALNSLPQEQRHLIEIAFLKGQTHHSIAESLGLPLGTVKTNIRRGLLRLRSLLKGALQ